MHCSSSCCDAAWCEAAVQVRITQFFTDSTHMRKRAASVSCDGTGSVIDVTDLRRSCDSKSGQGHHTNWGRAHGFRLIWDLLRCSCPMEAQNRSGTMRERFPHCIVWAPIPIVTWIFPFIGHIGTIFSQGWMSCKAGSMVLSSTAKSCWYPTSGVCFAGVCSAAGVIYDFAGNVHVGHFGCALHLGPCPEVLRRHLQ
jgi:hypothetical protein